MSQASTTTESSGSAGAGATRRRRRGGGTGDHAVEHRLELVGAPLPVEVALDHVEAVGDQARRERLVVEQPADRVGHRARVARRDDERGLAVDRVLAAAAVVGGDERRPARERLETGLAEALEPAPDREHPRRAYSRPSAGWSRFLPAYRSTGTPSSSPGLEDRVGALPRPLLLAAAEQRVAAWRRGTGRNTSRLTPPSCTVGRWPVSAKIWSAVQLLLASWRSTGAAQALPAAFLVVERAVVQRVEHPAPGVLEPVEQVPLRLVVEQHDVELVAEAGRIGLIAASQRIHVQRMLDAVGQVEGDLVTPRDEAVRELDHAPDPAEAAEMRLDETETQTPPRIRHPTSLDVLGYDLRPSSIV